MASLKPILQFSENQKWILSEGRIVYSRTKTMRVKNAPVVNYKLWKVTIEALRAVESQSEDLWFTTRDGQPLKTSKVVEDRSRRMVGNCAMLEGLAEIE